MDRDFYNIHAVFTPTLVEPTFIVGLPGIGDVGRITANMLIRFLSAKCFAELYSPYFSNFVIVDQHGLSHLPRYEFYASPFSKPNLIILTGDTQPMFQYGEAYYEINDGCLDLAQKFGSKLAIAMGGTPGRKRGVIYVATTSENTRRLLASQKVKRYDGRIVGAAGLLPGLARIRGLDAMSVLVSTRPFTPDKKAASSLFKFIVKALGIEKLEI